MPSSRILLKDFAGTIIRARVLGARAISPLLGVYWLLIFTGTHLPHPHISVPGLSDKAMHFGAYAGLSFLLCWAVPALRGRIASKLALAILACCLYGIVDELTQLLVRNRHAELLDYAADCLGAATGAAFYLLLRKSIFPERLLEHARPTDCPLQAELGLVEIDHVA